MENDPPHSNTTALTFTGHNNWASLPTLSQLTRNDNINQKSTPVSRRNGGAAALMDTGRINESYGGDKWENMSSQDATSMLISPPPEEVLRRVSLLSLLS